MVQHGFDHGQRREASPIEFADPVLRIEEQIAGLVFLDPEHGIAAKAVFSSESNKALTIVFVHATVAAPEPKSIMRILKNDHHLVIGTCNGVAA